MNIIDWTLLLENRLNSEVEKWILRKMAIRSYDWSVCRFSLKSTVYEYSEIQKSFKRLTKIGLLSCVNNLKAEYVLGEDAESAYYLWYNDFFDLAEKIDGDKN